MLEIELHSEKTPTFFSAHSMRTPSAVKGLSALQRQESQEVSQLLNTSTQSMCAWSCPCMLTIMQSLNSIGSERQRMPKILHIVLSSRY